MKKIITVVFLVLSLFSAKLFFAPAILAQTADKSPGLCYSQCGAYKFYWKGDFCFDMIQENCAKKFGVTDAISMLKGVYDTVVKKKLAMILDVKPIFQAWLICKPLIENCVAHELENCEDICEAKPLYYAPNLTVGSDWGSSFHGLFYDEINKKLSLRVMNNGLGYAWDIGVRLSYGSTDQQDASGMTMTPYLAETIPELLFLGSRQAAPKGVGDAVTDFLIDQSNFSKYLQKYKSDANNHYIPPLWEKTIDIEAPAGKLTRFVLEVDYDKLIPETSELDNTYVLEIDKRPTPAKFEFEKIEVTREENSLTNYQVKATIKNDGDLDGNALVSFYEGSKTGDNKVYGQIKMIKMINGHDKKVFTTNIKVDVANGSASCTTNKQFLATVRDENGRERQAQFEIPLYAGEINGRVMDKNDKPIDGVTVKASTGQTTTTNKGGYYHLGGISTLGEVTLTFTHPDYTAATTKKVTISFEQDNTILGSCQVKGLEHWDVNAVMGDQPLRLTVRLKSTKGDLLSGKVLFIGGAGVFSYEVSGEKVIEEMEPGQFRVTASSLGYITKEVQVVITPPDYTLEIVLELLAGRPSDEGLTLMTPVKLWEKTIEKGKIDELTGTKNGKLLVVNTNDSTVSGGVKNWQGKLTFINPTDGTIIKSVTVPFNTGQSMSAVALDASYDGRTVGFSYAIIPDKKKDTRFETFMKVFNASGNELGTISLGRSVVMAEVSPDGFYLCSPLMNSNLYKYTRKEIEGVGDGRDSKGCREFFLHDNNLVDNCRGEDGWCVLTLAEQLVRRLGESLGGRSGRFVMDSSTNDQTIIMRNYRGLTFFGKNTWSKELESDPGFLSAAVTPGGDYVIVAKDTARPVNSLAVFDKNGNDVTPKFDYKHVRFVEANDRGIFFATVVRNEMAYYQLGKYAAEYKPPEANKPMDHISFGEIQIYNETEKKFKNVEETLTWENLSINTLYKIKDKIAVSTSWGKLILSSGTVFAKNENGEPMLSWGQAEVEAVNPITMVVFKNKLPDAEKLYDAFSQYNQGKLPENKYLLIHNLHTDYLVKTENQKVVIQIRKGEVEAISQGEKINVSEGNKIVIDENNKIFRSRLIPTWFYFLGIGVVLIILFLILPKHRVKT